LPKFIVSNFFAGMSLAFFLFAGYCFQTAGLQYTTATNSGFITGSSVVLVPLLLGIFWGRALTKRIYAGAMAALIGLYFLTVPVEGVRYLNRGDVLTFYRRWLLRRPHHSGWRISQEHSVSALSVIQIAGCAFMAWPLMGFAAAIHWEPVRFEWGKALPWSSAGF
jgi:drug/metabolite transporter (DMT)-like permease